LGSRSPSPRCLTSYRVSPACRLRELTLCFPRTLVLLKAIVPSSPGFFRCSRQRDQRPPPRLYSTSPAHLSMCARSQSETRHDRRHAAHIHVFKDEHPRYLRLPVCFGGCPPAFRWVAQFTPGNPLGPIERWYPRLLIPQILRSIGLLTPRHRHLETRRPLGRSSLLPGKQSREDCFLSTDQDAFHRQPSED
jgi:hypothetical protein